MAASDDAAEDRPKSYRELGMIVATSESDTRDWEAFVNWMGKYHKMYKDEHETVKRFRTIQNALRLIDENKLLPEVFHCLGLNEIADFTREEFKTEFLLHPTADYTIETDTETDDECDEKDNREDEDKDATMPPVKRQRITGCCGDEEKDMELEIEEA